MISWESALFALIYTSAGVAAWLATYAIHSTLILVGIWCVQRLLAPAPEQRELMWKMGLLGGIITATLTVATGFTPLGGRYESAAIVEATWSAAPSASTLLRMLPILIVATWMLYAAGVITRVIHTTLHARRTLGSLHPADEATRAMVAAVGAAMGLGHKVDVSISDALSGPVVLGRAEITLPRRVLVECSAEEQRSIVAHEIAHVVRKDPWWLMVVATIESLFFFQRLNRMARVQWQEGTEYLCDDMAVRAEGSRFPLARSLARVAEWARGERAHLMAPALAEAPATLLGRVERILEHAGAQERPSRAPLLAAVALLALVAGGSPAFVAGSVRGWGTPAFHWKDVIAAGQSIEVQGVMGSIHAIPALSDTVEVRATRRGRSTNPDIRFDVVRTESGVTICAVYPTPAHVPANRCVPGNTGQFNTRANDVAVEFLIAVPKGVGLIASSSTGHITTGVLHGPVTAHSSSGNMDVTMAVADWKGALELESKSGHVKITLPRDADVVIAAATRTGSIKSAFDIGARRASWLERLKPRGSLGSSVTGVVGRGGREVVLSTMAGNIAINAR